MDKGDVETDSFKQAICLTVGYASCTVLMSEEGSVVERPAEERSELHPDVMLVTTADTKGTKVDVCQKW